MIENKEQMYKLMVCGALGNTLRSWSASDKALALQADLPFYRLRLMQQNDIDMIEVSYEDLVRLQLRNERICEPLDDTSIILQGYFQNNGTWTLEFNRQKCTMKQGFQKEFQVMTGLRTRVILRDLMTGPSWDDFQDLLVEYPDHIIELTICNRMIGSCPGRNTVIWEVRNY